MKAIVVFYSLTGKTALFAKETAKELQCDIREIKEVRKRSKVGAYVGGAYAAMKGKSSKIQPMDLDLQAYDTIFLTTPIWAALPVPAVNAFLEKAELKGKKFVLQVCCAGGDDTKAAAQLTTYIESRGGTVLQHYPFKTYKVEDADFVRQAHETAKLYKQ